MTRSIIGVCLGWDSSPFVGDRRADAVAIFIVSMEMTSVNMLLAGLASPHLWR